MLMTPQDRQTIDLWDRIQTLLVAFSVRDIQVANTLVGWLSQNDITADQFQNYVTTWTEINRLHAVGYFAPVKTVEEAKRVRAIEKLIADPYVRRYVRRMRIGVTPFTEPGKR
jgi:hypothetical protein